MGRMIRIVGISRVRLKRMNCAALQPFSMRMTWTLPFRMNLTLNPMTRAIGSVATGTTPRLGTRIIAQSSRMGNSDAKSLAHTIAIAIRIAIEIAHKRKKRKKWKRQWRKSPKKKHLDAQFEGCVSRAQAEKALEADHPRMEWGGVV